MPNNQNPLEKVFLAMDLSRGLDERARPEVGGDQSRLITQLDNLVQDESGGWVQRPGLAAIGSTTDDLGAAMPRVNRLIRSSYGLCAIGLDGRLYSYLENRDRFREKNLLPEFSVSASYVSASGASTLKPNTGHRVVCSASSTKYDVVMYEGGPSAAAAVAYSLMMVVFEKDSGTEIAKYDLSQLSYSTGAVPNCRAAFVADRYLHVWVHDSNLGDLKVFQHDTNSAFPANIGSFTVSTAIAGLAGTLSDIAIIDDRSIAICGAYIAYYTTAEVSGSQSFATSWYSGDVDDNGLLWLCGVSATNVDIAALTANNLAAAATYSWTDPSIAYSDHVIAAYGNGAIAVMNASTATFGSSTIPTINYYETTDPSDTSLTFRYSLKGWRPVSMPFRVTVLGSDRIYAHLCKHDSYNTLSAHVVARMNDYVDTKWTVGGAAYTSPSVSIAAVLDPFTAFQQRSAPSFSPGGYPNFVTTYKRYFWGSRDIVAIPVQTQTVSRSTAVAMYYLQVMGTKSGRSANFGGSTYISGGALSIYDGYRAVEQGFVDMPCMDVQDSGSGSGVDGSVNYVAVFRHVDANGSASYSRVYGPAGLTVADNTVTITLQPCQVTNRETGYTGDQQVVVDLYRTTSGGTTYYLCASSQTQNVGTTQGIGLNSSGLFVCSDSLSDASLASQPVLFRQPGTDHTPLDRYSAPASDIVTQHKDRIFATDGMGLRIYYSSYFVEGESAWFNPAFSMQAHGGSGRITALASMDGRLIIFRRNAIFVVDGDGPPENGGNGTEFSPPTRLATEYGCVDWRSMVTTPNGIMFRSSRGIELLDRSLQVRWIGDRVQTTIENYPHTTGAVMDSDGRVRFFLASDNPQIPGTEAAPGKEIVYDTAGDSWSTSTYISGAGLSGALIMTACPFDALDGETVAVAEDNSYIWKLSSSSFLDGSSFVPWTFETGYFRPTGTQSRFRLIDCNVLCRKRDNAALKVSLSYDFEDYDQDDVRKWEPDAIQKALIEVKVQPRIPQPVMYRAKVESVEPADTTSWPVGTGQSIDMLGIGFLVGVKEGSQQVAAFLKG